MVDELAPCSDLCTNVYMRDLKSIFAPGLNLILTYDSEGNSSTKCEDFIATYDIIGFNGSFVERRVPFQDDGYSYCKLCID